MLFLRLRHRLQSFKLTYLLLQQVDLVEGEEAGVDFLIGAIEVASIEVFFLFIIAY